MFFFYFSSLLCAFCLCQQDANAQQSTRLAQSGAHFFEPWHKRCAGVRQSQSRQPLDRRPAGQNAPASGGVRAEWPPRSDHGLPPRIHNTRDAPFGRVDRSDGSSRRPRLLCRRQHHQKSRRWRHGSQLCHGCHLHGIHKTLLNKHDTYLAVVVFKRTLIIWVVLTLSFARVHMCVITLSANIFWNKRKQFLHFFSTNKL